MGLNGPAFILMSERLEQVKEEFQREPQTRSMTISRIPKHAHEAFKGMANKNFAGDYGMTLVHLLYRFEDYDRLVQLVTEFEERLEEVEENE